MSKLFLDYRLSDIYDNGPRSILFSDLLEKYPELHLFLHEMDAALSVIDEQEGRLDELQRRVEDAEEQVEFEQEKAAKLQDRIDELELICDEMVEQGND